MCKAKIFLLETTDILVPDKPEDKRGIIDTVNVVLINAEELREKDIEFTDYGHHYTFKDITEPNIYIDSSLDKVDVICAEVEALIERMLMKFYKLSFDDVYNVGDSCEENVRKFLEGWVKKDKSKAESFLEKVDILTPNKSVNKIGLFDKIEVELINGEEYRKKNPKFKMGGHRYVYSDIPEDKVFIDGNMSKDDIISTMVHELTERTLMKYFKVTYSIEDTKMGGAHECSNRNETNIRTFLDKEGKSAF